jgi:hypothetical protein
MKSPLAVSGSRETFVMRQSAAAVVLARSCAARCDWQARDVRRTLETGKKGRRLAD